MKHTIKIAELSAVYRRRLSYVCIELNSSDSKYDQTMSILLRALSNVATVGTDGTSINIKCKNHRVSKAANILRHQLNDDRKWASQTINEHPLPLKNLWKKWKSSGKIVTEEEVWNDLIKHPMVTITKEEDAQLRLVDKKNNDLTSLERYKLANITLHSA